MLDSGIIRKSNSEWRSLVVMVKKSNGEFRFAVDYRKLNSVTKPTFFPIIRFGDVVDSIRKAQARLFSILDCASGFWQIGMHEETKHKAAFISQEGVFEWERMPFGLSNAPMSFQMVVTDILRDMNYEYVLVYIDDIIIFSKNFDQHLEHLSNVFQKLSDAGIPLKPSKCKFSCEKVKYLGHIISAKGIEVCQRIKPRHNHKPPLTNMPIEQPFFSHAH
ncbi:hypothetical protein SNE40_018451 [Patella caerulea]|uniref:Reverse transcriptase domain-containing protein n=1 Tax=Patella caerulea TaxID=87958 RepID=A0AAN8P7Z5_PATCE